MTVALRPYRAYQLPQLGNQVRGVQTMLMWRSLMGASSPFKIKCC